MSMTEEALRQARMDATHPLVKALRAARLRLGLTQKEVATDVGITHGALSGCEVGQRGVSLDVLTRWAAALGYEVRLVASEPTPLGRSYQRFTAEEWAASVLAPPDAPCVQCGHTKVQHFATGPVCMMPGCGCGGFLG